MAAFQAPFRFLEHSLRQSALRSPLFRHTLQRRAQSTAAAEVGQGEQSAMQKFWNSEVGPKTVHFWAPIAKWSMVLANLADLARPAETLSLSQNTALMFTGAIWTRWCFIIKPKNYFLATVNFFVFCTGTMQVSRILSHRRQHSTQPITEDLKQAAEETKDKVVAQVKG